VAGVDDTAIAALVDGSQQQPWRTATQPVALTGAWERLPRTGVLCSFSLEQLEQMAPHAPAFAHMVDGDWTYIELPTWHWPMISRAAELAEALLLPSGQPFRMVAHPVSHRAPNDPVGHVRPDRERGHAEND